MTTAGHDDLGSDVPHACFKLMEVAGTDAEVDLVDAIKAHLGLLFGSTQTKKLGPVWNIVLQFNQKSFVVSLTRSRYEINEWVLLIGTSGNSSFLNRLRGHKPVSCTTELKRITHEVHIFLMQRTGIPAVRWYFEGKEDSIRAVATPEELSWTR